MFTEEAFALSPFIDDSEFVSLIDDNGDRRPELFGGSEMPNLMFPESQDWEKSDKTETQLEDLLSILAAQVAPPKKFPLPSEESESEDSESDDRRRRPKKKKKKKEEPTTEAKQEMTRLRNREHARSTRKRKKEYVDYLKHQVAELLAKQQQFSAMQAETVSDKLRRETIETFLEYRYSNVDREKWRRIVDDHIKISLPATPYRPRLPKEDNATMRRLKGVDGLMKDSASISQTMSMISQRANAQKHTTGKNIDFTCKPTDLLTVGDRLMCHWKSSTEGLVDLGFPKEVTLDGFLKVSFFKNKIRDVEFAFDAQAIARQLLKYDLMSLSIIDTPRHKGFTFPQPATPASSSPAFLPPIPPFFPPPPPPPPPPGTAFPPQFHFFPAPPMLPPPPPPLVHVLPPGGSVLEEDKKKSTS